MCWQTKTIMEQPEICWQAQENDSSIFSAIKNKKYSRIFVSLLSNFVIPDVFHNKNTSEEKGFYLSLFLNLKPLMSHVIFPNSCKVAKLISFFKKGKKSTHLITGLSCCWH